jgi:ABC-type dipeptide/oligopeptide/nickel transport system permease component
VILSNIINGLCYVRFPCFARTFVTKSEANYRGPLLRNALNPLLSTIGYAFAGLLSGSLLVENVMNYPGLGRLVYEAFIREDQFVVLGSVVVGCSLLIVGNLISDLALAWSDPRVRYGR